MATSGQHPVNALGHIGNGTLKPVDAYANHVMNGTI